MGQAMTKHAMDINPNTRMRWEVVRCYTELRDLRGRCVLDLGSGLGYFSLRFKERGADVHAVDVDRNSLEYIKQGFDIKTSCADIEKDEFPAGSFDGIFIGEVLEHLKNPAVLLSRVDGALARGGFLLVTVPALEGPLIHTKGKALGHELGSEKHERDGFLFEELKSLIEKAGMKIVRHDMTIYWLAELFMQITKRGYLKKKKNYNSQANVIEIMKSIKYRAVAFLYPMLMLVFQIEQAVSSALGITGHCHVILAKREN